MHGRTTPGSRPMRSSADAIVAPVLPADTMAQALPSRTSSAARTSEESFFCRTLAAGSSPIVMTSLQAKTSSPRGSPSSSGIPTRMTESPSSSTAARAPATIYLGAKSPPIASRAMGRPNLVDLYGDATLVPTTVRAHDVGQFRRRALGTDTARRSFQGPVRGTAAAGLRFAGLALRDGHRSSLSVERALARHTSLDSPVSKSVNRSPSSVAQRESMGAWHSQVSSLRSIPQNGQSPLQSSRQS